jgi:alpha/beta hydrolase fold
MSRLRVRSTVMTAASPIVLEPAAQQVADAFSKPPFLYDMTPADARKVLEDAQSGPVSKLPVDEEWITVPAQVGDVRVRLIRPQGATGTLPVIVYMHGGGWILGNAGTHDRLVRELAVGARAALAFVSTRTRRKPATRPRSSRATPPPSGSPATGHPRAWTPAAWRWPVNRWAAT